MLDVIVCLKIVMDPEVPLSLFKIDKNLKRPIPPVGLPPVFSPFDLNALEAALKIKDQKQDECVITILSLGKNIPKALLQKALAMGADEAVVLEDEVFECLDPYSTAQALANAIRKIGKYDLIFTGRQAADWDSGIVWAGIAYHLQLPSITIARKAEMFDNRLRVERCVSDGIEVLETDLPALVTFSSEVGEPRFTSLKAMMQAKNKNITRWTASDIGFEAVDGLVLSDMAEPSLVEVDCQFIEGLSDEEKGRQLAQVLKDHRNFLIDSGGA
jgi:electron transfer flavoprotein beta subunit